MIPRQSFPIYLDHNATSPFDLQHLAQVQEALFEKPCANASSPHASGRRASLLITSARRALAAALNVNPAEIIFMASASEANNTVLKGLNWPSSEEGQCVSTSFEHPSINAVLKGRPKVSYVAQLPHQNGQRNDLSWARAIVSQITPATQLVTVMAANNETGHVFPVKLLGDFFHKLRFPESTYWADTENAGFAFDTLSEVLDERIDQHALRRLHFHVDATQAFGKVPSKDWVSAGIDSFAISGHKIGALPGSAALVVRRGRALHPLIEGGGQERFRRAGTENIPAIVSLGLRATELLGGEHWRRVEAMRELAIQLEAKLAQFSHLRVLSEAQLGLPNTVHAVPTPQAFYLEPQFKAEDTLIELDLRGIQASSGSACSSGTNRPSQVVLGLGFDEAIAQNALRFSLGFKTTKEEMVAVEIVLSEIFSKFGSRT